jgi:hypothetical protein
VKGAAVAVRNPTPAAGELWLSRPPYLLVAHILDVSEAESSASIEYELVDYEGDPLTRVCHQLDTGWWRDFQPLVRRDG